MNQNSTYKHLFDHLMIITIIIVDIIPIIIIIIIVTVITLTTKSPPSLSLIKIIHTFYFNYKSVFLIHLLYSKIVQKCKHWQSFQVPSTNCINIKLQVPRQYCEIQMLQNVHSIPCEFWPHIRLVSGSSCDVRGFVVNGIQCI